MQPPARRRDSRLETAWRAPEAVLFGRPQREAWPTPPEQGTERGGLGVGQGTRPRTPRLSNMGHGACVAGIGVGQRPGRVGNVAGLARIDHRERQARRRQRGDHGPLIAPSRFAHQAGGLRGLERRDEGGEPRVISGDRPACSRGA
jgi:hypothetical protein